MELAQTPASQHTSTTFAKEGFAKFQARQKETNKQTKRNRSKKRTCFQGHNRVLVPSRLGIVLIHGISRIDSSLCQPTVRREVEQFMLKIAKGETLLFLPFCFVLSFVFSHLCFEPQRAGEATYEDVLAKVTNMFVDKFEHFRKNIGLMDELFESCFSTVMNTEGLTKPLSRCGKCRRYMKLVHKQPLRLFCENCQVWERTKPKKSFNKPKQKKKGNILASFQWIDQVVQRAHVSFGRVRAGAVARRNWRSSQERGRVSALLQFSSDSNRGRTKGHVVSELHCASLPVFSGTTGSRSLLERSMQWLVLIESLLVCPFFKRL